MPNHIRKICIIAGEASGDLIGSKLVRALRAKIGDFKLSGVGGPGLIAEGMESVFDIRNISVMGFAEVLPRIFKIKKLIMQMVEHIIATKPDVVITIDSYGFNTRVIEKVRKKMGKSIKFVHYVAPTVWAYKPQRADVIANLYDLQLTLLPFEKKYFDEAGISCSYVGHPLVEDIEKPKFTKAEVFKNYGLDANAKLIVVMPGSRLQEIKYHATLFAEVLHKLKQTNSKINIYIPTLPYLKAEIANIFGDTAFISDDPHVKALLLPYADSALVKSGTSSLEMALYGVPTVVAYRMNLISYLYIKHKLKIKYASLINILNNEEIFVERIQSECTSENLVRDLNKILVLNPKDIKDKCNKTMRMLGLNEGNTPSEKAVDAICKLFISI